MCLTHNTSRPWPHGSTGINPADLTRQINAIQMQLLDLAKAKTEALAAARHIDLASIATVNQPIGQDEVAQAPHALTMREAPATTSRSLLCEAPRRVAVVVGVHVGAGMDGDGGRGIAAVAGAFGCDAGGSVLSTGASSLGHHRFAVGAGATGRRVRGGQRGGRCAQSWGEQG